MITWSDVYEYADFVEVTVLHWIRWIVWYLAEVKGGF